MNPGVFTPCCDLDEVKLLGVLNAWNATSVDTWIVVSTWAIQHSIPEFMLLLSSVIVVNKSKTLIV